jgi:hypothetical protein
MKILIIDSHKGTDKLPSNLHTLNAKTIADRVGADLVWSYPTVNDNIKSDYDAIVFNHASHYSYVDYAWVEQSPNAKLYYITNEYNLGEPRALWMAVKRAGRKYEVIANHAPKISKIVTKYTTAWHQLNLNALVFDPKDIPLENKKDCIYYGSYRKGREKYFKQYLSDDVVVSTHSKNRDKFNALGIAPNYINRIDWKKDGLAPYKTSLYIEDEITHNNYNYLANRLYEALNYNVVPLFSEECLNTLNISGVNYQNCKEYMVSNTEDIKRLTNNLPEDYERQLSIWKDDATVSRHEALQSIEKIITK